MSRYYGPMDTLADLPVRSRLPQSGTTIFTVMSALAQEHGAVNLGQGFPDYPIDPALIDRVTAAMRAGHNQYPLMPGVLALREAIARKVERLYGRSYDPQHEITVTTGATQAIFTSVQALLQPGDEAIVFEPAYDSYIPAIEVAGGTPVPLPLTFPAFRIDWDAVRRAITPRTRLILLNSPHNPTGAVFSRAELTAIAGLAIEHDLQRVVIRAQNNLAAMLIGLDHAQDALEHNDRGQAAARARGDRPWEGLLAAGKCSLLFILGRWDEMVEICEPLLSQLAEDVSHAELVQLYAFVAAARGDLDALNSLDTRVGSAERRSLW